MSHRGPPAFQRSTAVVTAVLGMLAGEPAGLGASEAIRDAVMARLPKYDPAIRASAPPQPAPALAPGDTAGAYGVKPNEAIPPAEQPPTANSAVPLALPDITVRARRDGKPEPALQLPRIVVRPPVKNLPPEEFETPGARDARLVKKHLTIFDRAFLNRFTLPLLGVSREKRARAAEAIERTARQLNDVADLLESERREKGDSEEARKLEELYREVFMARPK